MGRGVSELEFNVPFQHKHGYIRDEKGRGGYITIVQRWGMGYLGWKWTFTANTIQDIK